MNTIKRAVPTSVENVGKLGLDAIIREVVRVEVEKVKSDIRAEMETATKAINAPRTYTREQVCESLKCSQTTLSRMMSKGAIHSIKRGRRTLFPAKEFDEMLRQGRIGKYIRVK